MTNNERLEPCPFCGCRETSIADTGMFWVNCGNPDCETEGPVCLTPAEAIAAWNTRPASAAGDEMVEALKPLVMKADYYDSRRRTYGRVYHDGFTVSVNLGVCRKARAAITAIKGQ